MSRRAAVFAIRQRLTGRVLTLVPRRKMPRPSGLL